MASERYPRTDAALLNWASLHATVWEGGQSGPPDIGLSAQQLLDFRNAVDGAQAAYADQLAKSAASLASTENKHTAFDTLFEQIGSTMATIDAYFKTTKDPAVYSRAQIPAPKEATERDAPPQPVVKTPVQLSGGVIRVDFTVTSGGGAQYLVQRLDTRLDNSETDWFPVGTATEKFFEDQAVPFGLKRVQYRVAAQLSSGPVSQWSEPSVFSFGTQGSQSGPQAKAGSIEPVKSQDQKGAG